MTAVRALLIAAVVSGMTGGVGAEEIPQDFLDSDYDDCLAECELTADLSYCVSACNCTMEQASKIFSFDEYKQSDSRFTMGQSAPESLMTKYAIMVEFCARRAFDQ